MPNNLEDKKLDDLETESLALAPEQKTPQYYQERYVRDAFGTETAGGRFNLKLRLYPKEPIFSKEKMEAIESNSDLASKTAKETTISDFIENLIRGMPEEQAYQGAVDLLSMEFNDPIYGFYQGRLVFSREDILNAVKPYLEKYPQFAVLSNPKYTHEQIIADWSGLTIRLGRKQRGVKTPDLEVRQKKQELLDTFLDGIKKEAVSGEKACLAACQLMDLNSIKKICGPDHADLVFARDELISHLQPYFKEYPELQFLTDKARFPDEKIADWAGMTRFDFKKSVYPDLKIQYFLDEEPINFGQTTVENVLQPVSRIQKKESIEPELTGLNQTERQLLEKEAITTADLQAYLSSQPDSLSALYLILKLWSLNKFTRDQLMQITKTHQSSDRYHLLKILSLLEVFSDSFLLEKIKGKSLKKFEIESYQSLLEDLKNYEIDELKRKLKTN